MRGWSVRVGVGRASLGRGVVVALERRVVGVRRGRRCVSGGGGVVLINPNPPPAVGLTDPS